MITVKHPSEIIPSGLTDVLRQFGTEAEQMGKLSPEQLEIIYEQKWFNLFVPEKMGGMELSLVDGLQIEEALAWADGSTGWTVTLCGGANWFISFIDPGLSNQLFAEKKVCLAGSGKATGIAIIMGDEYEVTGYWNYATGAPHATAFTANCILEENGVILKNEDGTPHIRSFVFLREEVNIQVNWNMMGMVATGSHSFGVEKLRIGKERSFQINESGSLLNQPIYRYPFLQFAEATLAVNISGMAVRFLDIARELILQKNNTRNELIEVAVKRLQESRQQFYDQVRNSWNQHASGQIISSGFLSGVSEVSRELVIVSRKMLSELYPFCGLEAAKNDTEINRVWRNFHTAIQHSLFSSSGDGVA